MARQNLMVISDKKPLTSENEVMLDFVKIDPDRYAAPYATSLMFASPRIFLRGEDEDNVGQAVLTLQVGSYRFRADYDGVPFWSGEPNPHHGCSHWSRLARARFACSVLRIPLSAFPPVRRSFTCQTRGIGAPGGWIATLDALHRVRNDNRLNGLTVLTPYFG
jgi:hypothetical protein